MTLSAVVDTVLDRSVVLGFAQVGLSVRSRLSGWPADPPPDALLGRDVAVSDGSPVEPGARPAPLVGVYVDDRTQLSSVVLMDFRLAAFAGAALGLVPRGGAEAAIEDRDGTTFYVERTSPIRPIRLVRAPGFRREVPMQDAAA